MNKILISVGVTFLLTNLLQASDAVLPNDKQYYKYKENGVEIIYPKEHLELAKHTASMEAPMHKDYEKFFDWKLDETLYVGLISSNAQVANGYSTPLPNNRQINYIGGTQLVDYFATTSWLDTLLYHETAHNYQINIKKSKLSQAMHSVLGNGYLLPLPIAILPNMNINSFMLEGNAVLNESWHGNGGRLYSGRFKVETILQAASGNIIAGDVYNKKIAFPYGNIHYIQGGFYNLYLAKKYGLKEVNSFFKYYSENFFLPQFVNSPMKAAIGINFENSLKDFAREYRSMAQHLTFADGMPIANSQFFTSLSNSSDEIFFLTNESAVRAPELVRVNKESKQIDKNRDSYISGKVIKVGDKYLTQGSHRTSLTTIHQGLFDSRAIIKEDTKSKMIQGYLNNGEKVYFDVLSSFDQPQLYIGSEFYAQVNSSVVIDKDDNLYYFVQKGKTRTLYKNKTALYSFQGFYGIVSDVDSGGSVYFVANSEYGSTLYRFDNNKVTRAHEADNIIEARLVNDNQVLVAAISEKDYYYVINDLKTIDKRPFETKLFFEDKKYYGEYKENKRAKEDFAHIDLSDKYVPYSEMHYSGTNIITTGLVGNLTAIFADPLTQNATLLSTTYAPGFTHLSATYINTQQLLTYMINGYALPKKEDLEEARDYGFVAYTYLPLFKEGRSSATLSVGYIQDYEFKDRNSINADIYFLNSERYGVSKDPNYMNALQVYGSYESDNIIYGAKYKLSHDLPYEFYVGLEAKYSISISDNKGVKLKSSTPIFDEVSDIQMESLNVTKDMNSAGYAEVSLTKVINLSGYWFTFPMSLQRESIYTRYRYYKLEDTFKQEYAVNEAAVGIEFATIQFNSVPLNIRFEYIYNDAEFINNKSKVKFYLDAEF